MRTMLVVLLSVFFLVGCYETRQEFVLNPDGSGKVVLEARFSLETFSLVADEPADEKLKGTVRRLLEQSEGVETWQDVSFALLEDGRGFFRGTAYFRDVAGVKFHNLGNTKVKLARDTSDRMTFALEVGEETETPEKPAAQLSEAAVEKELEQAKARYVQELRPLVVAMFANMKDELLFHLPGSVQAGSNLQPDANGDIPFVFEGARVVAAMDRIFADDDLLRREIKKGGDVIKDGPSMGVAFQEMVFGRRPPFSAVLAGPFHPRFAYAEEVAVARANYAAMTEALGLVAAVPILPPPQGAGFQALQVGGVRLVKFSDLERGIRPFNHDAGYTLSIIGELAGPVIGIEEGEVLTALADTGANLLPQENWDRRISFPELSADKSTVIFDVQLLPPAADVRGIKELSGTLTYLQADGFREVDLGIAEFTPGTRGKEFGATIRSLGKNDWGNGEALAVALELPSEAIKEMKIYDEAGKTVEISGTSITSGENQAPVTKISETPFPHRGRIILSVYEQPRKFKIPFRLEKISLLGQPLP